ncbi:MAG TPA: hypothetical protein VFV09_13650 [Actinomycetota bacterium]|nr:hypothetical protein [Actinomycetota bacterium]
MKSARRTREAVQCTEGIARVRSVEVAGAVIQIGAAPQEPAHSPDCRRHPKTACQHAHFGYVVNGTCRFLSSEGAVSFSKGEKFRVGPGHFTLPDPGAEWVMFTSTIGGGGGI